MSFQKKNKKKQKLMEIKKYLIQFKSLKIILVKQRNPNIKPLFLNSNGNFLFVSILYLPFFYQIHENITIFFLSHLKHLVHTSHQLDPNQMPLTTLSTTSTQKTTTTFPHQQPHRNQE